MEKQAERKEIRANEGSRPAIPPEARPPPSIPINPGVSSQPLFRKRPGLLDASPDSSAPGKSSSPVQPAGAEGTPLPKLGSTVSLDFTVPGQHRDPFGPRKKRVRDRSVESDRSASQRKVSWRDPIRDDTPQHIREKLQREKTLGSRAERDRSASPTSRKEMKASTSRAEPSATRIDLAGDVEMEDNPSSSPVPSFEATPSSSKSDSPGPPIAHIKIAAPKWPPVRVDDTQPEIKIVGREGESSSAGGMRLEAGEPRESKAGKGKETAVEMRESRRMEAQVEAPKQVEQSIAQEQPTAVEAPRWGRKRARGDEETGLPSWLEYPAGAIADERERRWNTPNQTISAGSSSAYHLVAAQQAIRRDTHRNSRLLTRLLGTQQLISLAVQELDSCLDQYVEDGMGLE